MARIRQVTIRNYKSIEYASVPLESLTFLVGKNGSGKSNFLDALQFLADALKNSLEYAIREHGGINAIVRQGTSEFEIEVKLDWPELLCARCDKEEAKATSPDDEEFPAGNAIYAIRIGKNNNADFGILSERGNFNFVYDSGNSIIPRNFLVENGEVKENFSLNTLAHIGKKNLYLNSLDYPAYIIHAFLSNAGAYNIAPETLRRPKQLEEGFWLKKNGENAVSVYSQLEKTSKEKIVNYLNEVLPNLKDIYVGKLGNFVILQFLQNQGELDAASMSDGTLRALGILLALFQKHGLSALKTEGMQDYPLDVLDIAGDGIFTFVGIEEPESALHPAALLTLLKAFFEATEHTQILVTTHSPELLDNWEIADKQVLAVEYKDGSTHIGPIDSASRDIMREKLCTVGELLHQNQLSIDEPPESPEKATEKNHAEP
jgi:predicted ATPase